MEQITLKTQRINKNIDKSETNSLTGGLILRSTWKGKIPGHSTRVIKSGVAVHIPDGYYGVILNSKNTVENYPLLLRTQTVTGEDRDELILYVVNYSPYPELVSLNQNLGELVLYPIQDVTVKAVSKISTVKSTEE